MKIENIHIEGFGVWNEKSWGPLSPGMNVFHGPNETGKSTFMTFIRSILFGFERRGHPRRYEPLKGGTHGGWLDVEVKGRAIRIDRKAGRHVKGMVSLYEGETTGGEPELDNLLAGMTRTLYHNVFAFGLDELQQFHTLEDKEIAQHISGAALGIGAQRWTAVQRDLENRQAAMFLPRGQSSAINVALKELEAVRDDLDRTEHQPEEYWAAHEARTRLAGEITGLEEIVNDLKQRAAAYEKRLKTRPLWEKRKAIELKLEALPVIESFPMGGVERLELLRSQLRSLETEYESIRRDAEQRRLQRIELRSMSDPEEHARRIQVVELLRTLVPRVDAARRVYTASVERRKAIAQEQASLESAIESMRPPTEASFLAFVGLIWGGALGLMWTSNFYIAAAMFAVSLAPVFWYRQRIAAFSVMERQLESCIDRLTPCLAELKKVEAEARQIETEIRKPTGKTEITPEDIEARVAELQELSRSAEDLRRSDDAMERCENELLRLGHQIEEHRKTMNALFLEGAADTEKEFLERAESFRLRQQLLMELNRIPVEVPEPGLLFDIRVNEEEAFEAVQRELGDIEQRLVEARHESGRLEERISIMERSEERSRAIAQQEVILAKIDTAAEMWAVVTLCRTLLDETRKVYETERQPEVLRQSTIFFNMMTDGRYSRIIAPLDGSEIQVERTDGVRLSPQLLSRGTAEQLYMAMRLALVREYATHVDALPVVFDDIFVNFDPGRTRNTLQAVRELAETHQVLFFTCHPHMVEMVQEIVPAAKVFPLQ